MSTLSLKWASICRWFKELDIVASRVGQKYRGIYRDEEYTFLAIREDGDELHLLTIEPYPHISMSPFEVRDTEVTELRQI